MFHDTSFVKYSNKNKWQLDEVMDELNVLTEKKTLDEIAQINLFLIKNCDLVVLKDKLLKRTLEIHKSFSELRTTSFQFISMCKKFCWHTLHKKVFVTAFKIIIEQKVASTCDDDCGDDESESNTDEQTMLSLLKSWCLDNLFRFVALFEYDSSLDQFLWEYALHRFGLRRLDSLFNLILEFPDSISGIEELRISLVASGNIGYAGKVFRDVLRKRLLHIGASTSQILDYYISMVKALRTLDPAGLLLDFAAAPVRQYLKGRKDTVRCIVSSLTLDSGASDLHSELRQGGSLAYGVDEEDEEEGPGVDWSPQHTNRELRSWHAGLEQSSRGQDVLALLVSIYGSTDLFIIEFRSLLADRLLMNTKFAVDQELANLELLKIRFGEDSLHSCEVMIKDVEDSKRLNHAVFSKKKNDAMAEMSRFADHESVSFTIISENYWPQVLGGADMVLHPALTLQIGEFCDDYAAMKKPRKLYPVEGAGAVQLSIEFEDGTTRNFSVSLAQASVIAHLEDQSPLMLSELMALCGDAVEEEDVLQSVAFWIQKGVVRESHSESDGDKFFSVVEDQHALAALDSSTVDDDGVQQNFRMNAAADAQHKASLVAIEEYVRGMLSSHGPMDLERVSTMLKLLVGTNSDSDIRFDMNSVELRQYLQTLVDQAKIGASDGLYTSNNNRR